MINPPGPSGFPALPGPHSDQPPPDQPGQPVPDAIAEMLGIVRILAAYGQLLATVIPHRTLWPAFRTVARYLPLNSLSDTLTRIHRGIMRAIALERLLLKRAARGRDLQVLARPSIFTDLTPGADNPWPPAPEPGPEKAGAPHADEPPPGPHHASNRVNDRRPLWIDHLPSMAEVEQEVSRRPIGRTITAICLDLGIYPGLCTGAFWNRLFEAMLAYRGSVTQVMRELRRREAQFEREDWKYPRGLPLPARTQATVRAVMGFCIGEEPSWFASRANPFCPATSPSPPPAPGTGPP